MTDDLTMTSMINLVKIPVLFDDYLLFYYYSIYCNIVIIVVLFLLLFNSDGPADYYDIGQYCIDWYLWY